MLSDRMIDAYNKSRKATGEPKILVVINDSFWNIPSDVHKDESLDGWYDTVGNPVDPSTFWTTKSLDVAVGASTDASFNTEYDGLTVSQQFTFYTLYSDETYQLMKTSYAFIVSGVRYRLSSIKFYPTPTTPSLIEFSITLYDEDFVK